MAHGTAGRNAVPQSGTVDPKEVARFNALAQSWWDPHGNFRPLHVLNPTRLAFIRDHIAPYFGHDPLASRPLAGLSVLDIGCGGGLLAEPLARLGADVTGIDAGEVSLRIAESHARESGLAIDYRHARAEDLAAAGERFDVVLTMEVVEHVPDLGAFLKASCALVRPGGGMVIATLNRTLKAFALAIVGAEYVLRWLPRGTHQWNRFVRPSELAEGLRRNGLEIAEITGVAYDPLADNWHLSGDLAVNYMVFATRPGDSGGAGANQESR
jgi:2-polyprenyl-6-hydroxyphenyl methylase/3-demethylubiquinone-9 3-methyltransferase